MTDPCSWPIHFGVDESILATRLAIAVDAGDEAAIDAALAAGANPLVPVALTTSQRSRSSSPSSYPTPVTPAWVAVLGNQPHLLPKLLGSRRDALPRVVFGCAYPDSESKTDRNLIGALIAMSTRPESYWRILEMVVGEMGYDAEMMSAALWKGVVDLLLVNPEIRERGNVIEQDRAYMAYALRTMGAAPRNKADVWAAFLRRRVNRFGFLQPMLLTVIRLDEHGDTIRDRHFRGSSVLEKMLDDGLDPNTEIEGLSLLHFAVFEDAPETVADLLLAGANPSLVCDATCILHLLPPGAEKYLSAKALAYASGKGAIADHMEAFNAKKTISDIVRQARARVANQK
jgi:hypothetical protein